MAPIPLLTATGDAHARGLAHGRRFRQEIAQNLETYLGCFAACGLDRDAAFGEAEPWREAIAALAPAYSEEMRGIAEGAGQTEAVIALLNARYELAFSLFGREAMRQELLEVVDGCTTFGLLPEITADRHSWLGQNWDWLEGVHGRTFVLRVERNAASASSRMGWRRTMTAGTPTASRSMCVAARCWTPKAWTTRCLRSARAHAPAPPIS